MSIRRLFLGKRGENLPGDDRPPEDMVMTQRGWQHAVYVIRRDPLAMFGLFWIAVLFLLTIGAPVLAPYPEAGAGRTKASARLLPPSHEYALGTDELGRDLLSRIIYATRPAMTASLVVVSLAVLIGAPLGAVAGYFGGWVDEIVMRITDLFLAFPSLLLAMAIVALLEAIPALTPAERHETTPLEGSVPSPLNPPPGCRFHTRCPLAQDICRQQEPVLESFGPTHAVACHFAE